MGTLTWIGLAVGVPAAALAYLEAVYIGPAARMLWVEHREGTESGDASVTVARVLFNRARRTHARPAQIVLGEAQSPGDGAWNADPAYRTLFLEAPTLPQYQRAARMALVSVLAGVGDKRERWFSHGRAPVAAWIDSGKVARTAGAVAGRTLWVYR